MSSAKAAPIIAFALVASALSFNARADTPASAAAGLVDMNTYNLIVLGDMTATSDVEGRALIGGNLSGGGTFFKTPDGQTSTLLPGLIVGGNVTGYDKSLDNRSGAWVGGDLDASFNLNGGAQDVKVGGALNTSLNLNGSTVEKKLGAATALAGLPQSIPNVILSLKDLSTALAALPTTTAAPVKNSNSDLTFNLAGLGTGTAVIDLDPSQLTGSHNQLNFNTGSYNTVIVNVAGTSDAYNYNVGTFSNLANTKIIWNFYQATTLTLGTEFEGSILAPLAAVTNSTPIEGTLVAASFIADGEVHMPNYEGTLKLGAVPEPATWAMMIGGVFGVGGVLRRQRRVIALA